MGKLASQYLVFLTLGVALQLFSACVTPAFNRANPRLQTQTPLLRTVAVMPSEVKVYQIDAGGVREEIADWSNQARGHIVEAVGKELGTRLKATLKFLDEEALAEEKTRLEETRALYGAVATMVFVHTFVNPNAPSQLFAEKEKNFDYSLGSEVSPLAKGAGALLLLDAQDHVWSAGRQALQALGVVLGIAASVATRALIIPQMGGGTSIRAALVDSGTGDILWMNSVGAGGGKDLRTAVTVNEMVAELFKDFPSSHDTRSGQEDAR